MRIMVLADPIWPRFIVDQLEHGNAARRQKKSSPSSQTMLLELDHTRRDTRSEITMASTERDIALLPLDGRRPTVYLFLMVPLQAGPGWHHPKSLPFFVRVLPLEFEVNVYVSLTLFFFWSHPLSSSILTMSIQTTYTTKLMSYIIYRLCFSAI